MSEARWAQKREWEQERGALEVNSVRAVQNAQEFCVHWRCNAPAVNVYEVRELGRKFSSLEIALCEMHDSEETAFKIYRINLQPD